MKRSEMIKLISNVILHDSTEFSLTAKEADVLLKAIEQAGMLPPYNENSQYYSRADADGYEWELEQSIEDRVKEVWRPG